MTESTPEVNIEGDVENVNMPDSTPDPEADATQDDALATQTDNTPTEEDGPQEDVDQNPTSEDEVQDDDGDSDGESVA